METSPAQSKLTPSKLVFPSFDNLNNYVPQESQSNSSIYSITDTNEITNRQSKPLPSNTISDQLSNLHDDNDIPHSQTINVQDYLQSERNQVDFQFQKYNLQEKIYQLNQDLQNQIQANSHYKQEIQLKEEIIQRQKNSLEQFQSKIKTLTQEKLQLITDQSNNYDIKLKQANNEKQQAIHQLNSKYQAEIKSLQEKLSSQIKPNNISHQECQKEILSEQEKNNYLSQRIDNLKNEIEYMQTAIQEKDNQIAQLQSQVNDNSKIEEYQKHIDMPKQETNSWDSTLNSVISEYVQFIEDYRTSSLFPYISDIHSPGFIKIVHHIQSESDRLQKNQHNVISKCMSIQQIVTLLLIEIENLLKFIHKNKMRSNEEQDNQRIAYLEQQSRNNLYNVVQQKSLEEIKQEMNILRGQNQQLQEKIYQKQQNYGQPQIKTVYVNRDDGQKQFYEKLIETVSNYMCNGELKNMVQNVLESRNRYDDKDLEYQQRISHLEQLDQELKHIVKGGEQNETNAYQIRKIIEKEREQLGFEAQFLSRVSEQMCLLKQVSFSEQQKMQHILSTQRDYLKLKQSHEELQYEHRNMEVEMHMLKDTNEKMRQLSQQQNENKENDKRNTLYFNSFKKTKAEKDSGISNRLRTHSTSINNVSAQKTQNYPPLYQNNDQSLNQGKRTLREKLKRNYLE